MRIAFLDFGSAEPAYATVTPDRMLAWHPLSDTKDEIAILPQWDAALREAETAREDITHIACVTGPGGFVSLRVGVTLANTLAYTLRVPIAGVHLSDLWHARLPEQDAIWLHSTRKEQLFIRGFGRFAERWPEPMLISLEEAKEMIDADAPLVGELIPAHEEIRRKRSAGSGQREAVSGQRTAEEVLPALLAGLPYKTGEILQPWYGRGIY